MYVLIVGTLTATSWSILLMTVVGIPLNPGIILAYAMATRAQLKVSLSIIFAITI